MTPEPTRPAAGDPATTGTAAGDPAAGGPARRRVGRRGVLVAAGSALVVGATGVVLVQGGGGPRHPPTPPTRSPGVPPGTGRSVADVLRDAQATAGVRLRGSPWEAWAATPPVTAPWDGLYVAWLLRGHGAGPAATSPDDLLALVRSRGRTGVEPSPGALAFYRRGSGSDVLRVGLVTSTAGTVRTLEGDHPVPLPPAERFVRRFARPGPGLMTYGLPGYGA